MHINYQIIDPVDGTIFGSGKTEKEAKQDAISNAHRGDRNIEFGLAANAIEVTNGWLDEALFDGTLVIEPEPILYRDIIVVNPCGYYQPDKFCVSLTKETIDGINYYVVDDNCPDGLWACKVKDWDFALDEEIHNYTPIDSSEFELDPNNWSDFCNLINPVTGETLKKIKSLPNWSEYNWISL